MMPSRGLMLSFPNISKSLGWYLWLFSLLLVIPKAQAANWQLAPGSETKSLNLEELQRRFPDVSRPDNLASLLKAISQLEPMAQVEAFADDSGAILIRVLSAATIGKLEVTSLTRRLRIEIEGKLGKYIGQTDSEEVRKQIEEEVKTILQNEGYLLAKLNLQRIVEVDRITYVIRIDEDFPCTVSRIEFSFRLPDGISNPFERGMFCDIDDIRIRIGELESDLVSAGYNQQRIQSPDLQFNPETNTGVLKINGSLGKKIRYEIASPIKPPALISLIFGDDLNTLDPTITDPDAMASELSRQYKNQGFEDVEVSPPRTKDSDGDSVSYLFQVNPGPEYRIIEVQFEGLLSVTQSEALDAMNLYPNLGNTPLFSQEVIRQARENLLNFYKQRGYWDIRVFDPRIIKNPSNGDVKVVYVVREGKRRIFSDLIITGNRAITSDSLSSMFPVDKDEALSWVQLIDFEKSIRNVYRQQGYLQVQMNIELLQNRQFRDIETKVLLTIQEGQRSRFGEIYIKGLVKTDPEVVQRELRFQSGDWFTPDRIEESRQALIDLGLFSSVSITPAEPSSDSSETVSYTILLREARSGTVSFGPGWSLGEGLRFSVESSYNNIGGTGRKIFSKGSLNEEKDQTPLGNKTLLGRYAGVGYLEPYLGGLPVDGTLTFNYKAVAQAESWEISRSAEAIGSHRLRGFTTRTNLELFTLYKETREEAEGDVKKATLMEAGNLQIRELGLRHVTDARNNIAWPTRGFRLSSELGLADYVFGGSLKYNKWALSYTLYRELYPNWVFAAGFAYKAYTNISRRDGINVLPSTERLPSGGSESNRGFRENTLGPVFVTGEDQRIYDGGSRQASHKLELRHQLIQDTLAMTSFLDSSNSFFSATEEQLIREEFEKATAAGEESPQFFDNEPYAFETVFTHPQYLWTKNYLSYGLSLNYLTPLGSVNLSLGWPWRRCLNNQVECEYPRGNSNYRNLRGAVIGLNIGANF